MDPVVVPGGRDLTVPVPLYQAKAEFFRTLGHPDAHRVLELLQDGPLPVRDLLAEIEIEASNLSQQLAVLRRAGIVRATREGPTVVYQLSSGDVAELLRTARRILTDMIVGQEELLAELRAAGTGQPSDAGRHTGDQTGGATGGDAGRQPDSGTSSKAEQD
jgi:ArsR family transcriptional regulator